MTTITLHGRCIPNRHKCQGNGGMTMELTPLTFGGLCGHVLSRAERSTHVHKGL